MEQKTKFFTAKRLAILGVLTALAFGVSLISIPIFPFLPFLKLDFSFAIMLLTAYVLGPTSAVVIIVVVNFLRMFIPDFDPVGALANTITASAFVILPSVIYKFKKGLPSVIISIPLCSVLQIGLALLANRYVLFPFYGVGDSVFTSNVWFIALFNLIKCVSNGTVTILLYKRLKNLLGKI